MRRWFTGAAYERCVNIFFVGNRISGLLSGTSHCGISIDGMCWHSQGGTSRYFFFFFLTKEYIHAIPHRQKLNMVLRVIRLPVQRRSVNHLGGTGRGPPAVVYLNLLLGPPPPGSGLVKLQTHALPPTPAAKEECTGVSQTLTALRDSTGMRPMV